MFRKSVILMLILLPILLFGQQGFKVQHIKNAEDSTLYFNIQDVEVDTSMPFHIYDKGSMKFFWNGPDSGLWKAEIYTSPVSPVFDTTYTLAQTIVAAGDTGVSVPKPVFVHPEMFGVLIITGLTGNTKKDSLYGQIIYTGVSDQSSASLTKFMGRL